MWVLWIYLGIGLLFTSGFVVILVREWGELIPLLRGALVAVAVASLFVWPLLLFAVWGRSRPTGGRGPRAIPREDLPWQQ